MILGMRLWYGFYGTTLASEGAFESKMEELCRELGERGTRAASKTTVGTVAAASAHNSAAKAALMSDDDPGGRIDFVDGLLECIGARSASVSRKDRKELGSVPMRCLRTSMASGVAGVGVDGRADCGSGEASEALWAAEKTPDMASSDVRASCQCAVGTGGGGGVAWTMPSAAGIDAGRRSGADGRGAGARATLLEKLAMSRSSQRRKPHRCAVRAVELA